LRTVASTLRKLDDFVYRGERALVVGALLLMSVVVFLDVIHGTFADPESKLAGWLTALAGGLGVAPESAAPTAEAAAPAILFVVLTALVALALLTAKRDPGASPPALPRVVGIAVAIVAGLHLAVVAMLWLVPNGFLWAQPLALVLTLWVGFVGASMVTHDGRHLKVEAVSRALPARVKPWVALVSHLFTAAFCAFLLWMSVRYVAFAYEEWVQTDYKGGNFAGINLPKWIGFAVLPLSFTIMTLRFIDLGIRAFHGEVVEHSEVPLPAPGSGDGHGDAAAEVSHG
jgi:TRAP-type C4-dicarboxylate transport system permease small subunit